MSEQFRLVEDDVLGLSFGIVRIVSIDTFRSLSSLGSLTVLVLATGCGAATTSPADPTTSKAAPVTETPTGSPTAAAASSEDDAKPPDPNESPVAIVMTPLFSKEHPPKFPKATISDHDCWQGLELSGSAKEDYDSLVQHCGSPTGVVEYARPAMGHLHHKHDKRDTFKLKLAGGYCYRYFAVGDSSIADLDILVERYGGDMVGDDQTKGPVAIIQSDKPWCMDDDIEYDFDVAVDGAGQGNYVIGVWARPK